MRSVNPRRERSSVFFIEDHQRILVQNRMLHQSQIGSGGLNVQFRDTPRINYGIGGKCVKAMTTARWSVKQDQASKQAQPCLSLAFSPSRPINEDWTAELLTPPLLKHKRL